MNILIQLRKLREGIISSSRCDRFAIEVYELSFFLSVLFESSSHTNSTASRLIPNLYKEFDDQSRRHKKPSDIDDREQAVTVHLVQCLAAEYPVQSTFRSLIRSQPLASILHTSSLSYYTWWSELSTALRSSNWIALTRLTSNETIDALGARSTKIPTEGPNLPTTALTIALGGLKDACREQTWSITQKAYRELSLQHSNYWIKVLLLTGDDSELRSWIAEREKRGEMKPKPDSSERWLLCRPT